MAGDGHCDDDEMVTLLKAEQGEDSSKKPITSNFDVTGDEAEAVQKSISELDASVARATES